MNTTYILSDFSDRLEGLTKKLQLPESNVIPNETHENSKDYHDWLNKIFQENEIEKIIIPVSLASDQGMLNTDGLLLGLHIRLNYELPISKRTIPIIFLSNFTIENIIKNNTFDQDNNPQNLIFTQGVYFSSFEIEEINESLDNSNPCLEEDYKENILSKLKINRKESTGGHDIANAWGCYKLAQVAGMQNEIFDNEEISSYLKKLYAKFLICNNESYRQKNLMDLEPLKSKNKRVLFIDDKADQGWGFLMKNIFQKSGEDFVLINPSRYKGDDKHKSFIDFDGFYQECRSKIGEKWDLIIIDLRLNPEKEDIDSERLKPEEFSGYKLIDEFLSYNEGYQIMVSTASNKIWNINSALKRGAFSYYIKESPEFNYPISETQKYFQGFKKDIYNCFERSYLQEIFGILQVTKNKEPKSNQGLNKESNSFLKIAWDQINSGNLNFGYLTIFQILEKYTDLLYEIDTYEDKLNGKTVVDKSDPKENKWCLNFNKDRKNGDYFSSETDFQDKYRKPTTLFKTSCLLKFGLNEKDSFLKKFGALNRMRNEIAHGNKDISASKNEIIKILELLNKIKEV